MCLSLDDAVLRKARPSEFPPLLFASSLQHTQVAANCQTIYTMVKLWLPSSLWNQGVITFKDRNHRRGTNVWNDIDGENPSKSEQPFSSGLNILKIHLRPMLEPLDKLDYNISECEEVERGGDQRCSEAVQAQYADFQVNDPFAKARPSRSLRSPSALGFQAFNAQADVIHQHIKAQTLRSCHHCRLVLPGKCRTFCSSSARRRF